ncbi:MAG: hypothetical protein EOO01_23735 [Chitinophagaceae bacterium]|nr:MAG: hypothetical protein EOO01_23735 [Chitinophagaceae bacterium]
MILNLLRSHTKDSHQAVEKLLIPKIKKTQEEAEYRKLLALFYGFFHPLEQKIELYVDQTGITDWHLRRKSEVILSDYALTGGSPSEIAICTDLPQISSESQALGAMYVMEGSTLGGQVITSMLSKNLGLSGTDRIKFFNGYGADTAAMWTGFTDALNNYPAETPELEIIAEAARQTFTKLKTWISAN